MMFISFKWFDLYEKSYTSQAMSEFLSSLACEVYEMYGNRWNFSLAYFLITSSRPHLSNPRL